MWQTLLLAALAGATIPLGGWLASVEHIRARWLEEELRHTILAFGGGALISAVALVLVPRGVEELPGALAVGLFVLGGALFAAIDALIARHGGSAGNLVAMLTDFVPESVALGALLAAGRRAEAVLMAVLIAAQNLPESFNAWREMAPTRRAPVLLAFAAIATLGPVAAAFGQVVLADHGAWLGGLLMVAAGGILYLMFEDVAPQVPLERSFLPPLGAIAGFALGLAGYILAG